MNEMVDRVARALVIADGVEPTDGNISYWRNVARAAIEAMRLDEDAWKRPQLRSDLAEDFNYVLDVVLGNTNMIDAALGITPTTGDRTEGKPKP